MEIENLSEDSEEFTGNVWKLTAETSGGTETVLVDAGTGDSVWKNIMELERIDRVVITHSHHDHVDNLPQILDLFEPDVYAYEPENLPVESSEIDEEDILELCGEKFEIIHTPGHRDDSVCLYSESSGILFSGDLIFPDGEFGRTDLDEGDRDLLIDSVKKIVELDVGELYSGHGDGVKDDVEDQIKRSLREAEKHEPKYS